MKAKSWKTLVKKQPEEEQEQKEESSILSFIDDLAESDVAPTDGVPSLEAIAAKNSNLKSLLEERKELEQQMSLATGGGQGTDWADDPRFRGGEIPSINQKQERDRLWAEARQRAADRVQAQREKQEEWEAKREQYAQKQAAGGEKGFLNKLSTEADRFKNIGDIGELASGLSKEKGKPGFTVDDSASNKTSKEMEVDGDSEMTTDVSPKQNKKEEAEASTDPKPKKKQHTLESLAESTLDRLAIGKQGKMDDAEWEAKREKRQENLRKAKKAGSTVVEFGKKAFDGIDKLYGTIDDLDKRLKSAEAKAKEASKANGSDGFGFTDDDGGSMGGGMMDKITENPMMKGWGKVREKKKEALQTKKVYEKFINKALSTDLGSLVNLDKKADKLRQKAQEKRKAERDAEKKEEKKREQKAEERRERKRQQKRERN